MTTARVNRDQLFQGQACNTLRRPGVAADIIGGADFNIFNVGGMISIVYMFGVITEVISAHAVVYQVQFTPTVGPGQVALSAAHATMTGAAAGTILTWDGLTGGALTSSGALGVSDIDATSAWLGNVINIPAGIIAITNAVAGTGGIVDWYIAYIPMLASTTLTVL